jgi:hypothetical protein
MAGVKFSTFQGSYPDKAMQTTQVLLCARGTDNDVYCVDLDPASGGLVASTTPATPTAAVFPGETLVLYSAFTASFVTKYTTTAPTVALTMRSNCDEQVIVSLDGGTTTHFTLDPYDAASIDFGANTRTLSTGAVIAVKHAGTIPTQGSLKINIVY